jgi:alkyl hydroperoxide reductase subunit AhpF
VLLDRRSEWDAGSAVAVAGVGVRTAREGIMTGLKRWEGGGRYDAVGMERMLSCEVDR